MNELGLQHSPAPALLVNISSNERHYTDRDELVIGRSNEAFICIKHGQVSRRHCVINRNPENNSFTICDLSAFGTFLNGKQLTKHEFYALNHHDKICLANIKELTYEVLLSKKYQTTMEQSKALNSNLKEKIVNLDSTYVVNMKRLEEQIDHFVKERSSLSEEIKSRLQAQENYFEQERNSLSNLLTNSTEQKVEAEEKLKEMEAIFATEKSNLLLESERKLLRVAEREEELLKSKMKMEDIYQKERTELEERCRIEIEQLKEKLAVSEQEQDRLKEETLEAEQKLKETEKTLLESELEQFRLHQEKVEVESKLGSKIVVLTQQSTSKEEMVKVLEKKLRDKEIEEELKKKEMESLEEEILCSICTELYIQPIVLNCGHMFCKLCIDDWKAKKKNCPMCRKKISTIIRIHSMDSIVNRSVMLMSAELRKRREEIIKERSGDSSAPSKRRKTHRAQRQEEARRGLQQVINDVAAGNPLPSGQIVVRNMSLMIPSLLHEAHGPSTSAAGVRVQINNSPFAINPEPDPFSWTDSRLNTRSSSTANRTESPMTIAIDLTHHGSASVQPTRRRRNATSTITSAADTTIDLTSP